MLLALTASLRRDPIVWTIAAALFLLQMALAGRYDIFRNELYYIVCGRHPAFGYADQPPLVPLLAAASQIGGINPWALRLPAALAGAALVPLTASFARLLGGTTRSAILAAVAVATAPALLALTQIMTTSTFEPLAWTLCATLITRAVVTQNPRALIWAGVTAGIACQAKYGIAIWLVGLLVGLLATPARAILRTRACAVGLAAAALIALPSLIWQTLNGWPFLAVMLHHTVGGENYTGSPIRFEIGQVLALSLLMAPLWLTGLIAPFTRSRVRFSPLAPARPGPSPLTQARFLAIAYVVSAIIVIAAHGKNYYLYPAYPTLFAIGAAACARLPRWAIGTWATVATAATIPIAPVVLPLLDPPALAAYLDRHHLHPRPNEAAAVGAPLTQVFSDELGWRALEKSVAALYRALPPDDRRRAAIIASNYGEAAAIDVYGAADGLPPALSGQDQYYFWGPRGYDGSVIIHINGDPERWRPNCASLDIVGTFGAPLVMPYENNRPIFICRGVRVPLDIAWPRFKRF